MKIIKLAHIVAFLAVAMLPAIQVKAQKQDDVLLNRPYADLKKVHFGFSVGANVQDLKLTNNGYTTPEGERWYADVAEYSPGFCVNVLADLRLGTYFNLRFSPGMYFGNKVVTFCEAKSQEKSTQNVKTSYVVLPVDLKYSAERYHNMRPYFTTGFMGVVDVSKKRSEQLAFNNFDPMITFGLGCDFYLSYFKFCPEIKFCFGLSNILNQNRPDLQEYPAMQKYTQSVSKAKSNMIVVTFYFE